jgi:predicted  nucleic acid-binding Zn-ribbon protein
MNNTPETEKVKAALHTNWHDLLNHARKLECERDEAREKYATEATEHVLNVNKLCGERDDARNKIADALQEVDLRTLDFYRMKQERDEARDAIVGWENKWKCAIDMAARAELERDDALDDAKEYHIKMVGLINERNDAREDARLLSERLTALELQSTAELARLEQELINIKELYESNN